MRIEDSRDAAFLLPSARAKHDAWVLRCQERGVSVLTYCTWRGPTAQERLYARGRSVDGVNYRGIRGRGPGFYVTMARPWSSSHQYGVAWDAVPMVDGKPDWSYADVNRDQKPDEPWWNVMVEEAETLGIEWAGRWNRFREYVHWQFNGGQSFATLRPQIEAHLASLGVG